MIATDLLDIMRESRLPESEWPCEPGRDSEKHWWLHGAYDQDHSITIEQAAALCEVRLRRAIRAAVGDKGATIQTWMDEEGWYIYVLSTTNIEMDFHGDFTELHAIARLHAAVVKEPPHAE